MLRLVPGMHSVHHHPLEANDLVFEEPVLNEQVTYADICIIQWVRTASHQPRDFCLNVDCSQSMNDVAIFQILNVPYLQTDETNLDVQHRLAFRNA